MRPRSLMLILIALGCGAVASFAAFQVVDGGPVGPQASKTVKVFVAMSDVDINEKLDSTNVKVEQWPEDRVPKGAITKLKDVEGHYAGTRMFPGEIILKAKLMDAQAGAAKDIPTGYRVCTVKVEVDTSNHGLVRPGDRVDISVFLRKGGDIPTTGIRTILRDVRVFAVNSQTKRSDDKEEKSVRAQTVSFLCKPKQASKLLLAGRLGVLQLSLRHPNESNEGADEASISVDSILNEGADRADETNNSKSNGGGLGDFLKSAERQQTAASPAVAKPKFKMVILLPGSAQTYLWKDSLDALPEVEGEGNQTAPAAAGAVRETPLAGAANDPLAVEDGEKTAEGGGGEEGDEEAQ